MRLNTGTLNKVAISRSLSPVCLSPVRVFIYNVGKTIRAGMNVANCSVSIQSSERITKEATGTDFITFIGNHSKTLTGAKRYDSIANVIPKRAPKRKPFPMASSEFRRLSLKASDGSSSFISTEKTLPGVGKKISLSILMAAMCQMIIQKKMERV